MKFLEKYTNSTKVAFYIVLVSACVFILMIPCFFFSLKDIPLGVLLGGVTISLTYSLEGIAEKSDNKRGTFVFTIVTIAVKLLITAGILVVICFMYYRWGLPIFNPFAYVGIYTLALIINIIVHIKERKARQ